MLFTDKHDFTKEEILKQTIKYIIFESKKYQLSDELVRSLFGEVMTKSSTDYNDVIPNELFDDEEDDFDLHKIKVRWNK